MITLFTATNHDTNAILAMMKNFNQDAGYHFDETTSQKTLSTFLSNKDLGRLWLIQQHETTIGYIAIAFGFSFEHGGRDGFIDELFIKPQYRGQKFGTMTLSLMQSEAKKLGVNILHLEVEPENKIAYKLYQTQGFRDNDRLLMSKKLTNSSISNTRSLLASG